MANASHREAAKHVYRRSGPSVEAAALPRSTAEFYAMRQHPVALANDPAVKRYLENKGAKEKRYEPVGTGARKASLTGKNKASKKLRVNMMVGIVLLVLVAAVVLVAIQTDFTALNPINMYMSPTQNGVAKDGETEGTGEVFAGTVLPETEDAGAAYISETLFLGDSNTVRLGTFSDVTGLELNNHIGVEGMSVEGALTYSAIQFEGMTGTYTMVEALAVLQPRRIVLALGTNNVSAGQSAELFSKAYAEVLDGINATWPYADVIIASVPPIDMYCTYQSLDMVAINSYNTALEDLAKSKGCKFLNWTETLMDKTTGFMREEYSEADGLHITAEAASAMIYYVRTHSYIAPDRRPASSAAIPQHLPLESTLTGLNETTGQGSGYQGYDYSTQTYTQQTDNTAQGAPSDTGAAQESAGTGKEGATATTQPEKDTPAQTPVGDNTSGTSYTEDTAGTDDGTGGDTAGTGAADG